MVDFRPVLFLDSLLLVVLAVAMGAPACFGQMAAGGDGAVFLGCAAGTAAVGFAVMFATMPTERLRLNTQQSFVLIVSAILLVSFCAAFPFRFASPHLSYTDAWFEAVSGLTTTGATMIGDLDHSSHAVLLWRALLNWLGGIGIIVMTTVLLPSLKLGGAQMAMFEDQGKAGFLRGRIVASGKIIIGAYGVATLMASFCLWWAGMGAFDAVCHAMSALSTGGFSTSDQSIGHWGAAVQWVILVTMVVGASSYPLMVLSLRQNRKLGYLDQELWSYLLTLGGFASTLLIWRWSNGVLMSPELVRITVFTVVSFITTTGFVVSDYALWGGSTHVVFFLMLFVGGCVGSATGGIKIFRWRVLASVAKIHVVQMVHPHRIMPINFNGAKISESISERVLAFFILYMLTFAVYTGILAALGMDIMSALSASASGLGHVGRGVSDVIGASGNWHGLSKVIKWVLSSEMLVGRLEIFAVLILFTPSFWKE